MTNTLYKKMTVFSLILMLGLMPAFSYADNDNGKKKNRQNNRSERVEKHDDRDNDRDEDDDGDEDRDEDRKSEKKEKGRKNSERKELCRTAFGRLFAPGFVNNWGAEEREFFWNCFVPFGIAKKFNGTTSSTTPSTDVTAPVISNLLAKPNTIKATITWNTNEKSDSTVFWSNSANVNVNSSSTASTTRSEKVKEHKLVIEGLSASTTYYFVVRSKDGNGNTSTSTESSFTTKPVSTDSSAPVISSVTLLMSTSTANIGWHTNENATSRVYYGTSSGLDVNASTTSFVENSTLKQNHLITVSGLATSTLYYFAAESRDGSGNRTVTPVFSATTSN
ncbi:MAG: fibronectin type III domain-containing protein [Patescibacteria group bacterium]